MRLRADGAYDYVTRKDHQIKVMGFRVELGEIETALNAQIYVGASAALGRTRGTGDMMIVAFVELKETIDDTCIEKICRNDPALHGAARNRTYGTFAAERQWQNRQAKAERLLSRRRG